MRPIEIKLGLSAITPLNSRRYKSGKHVALSVTLIVDGQVVDGRFVRLSGGESTAGEMNMVRRTQYKHSPTDT